MKRAFQKDHKLKLFIRKGLSKENNHKNGSNLQNWTKEQVPTSLITWKGRTNQLKEKRNAQQTKLNKSTIPTSLITQKRQKKSKLYRFYYLTHAAVSGTFHQTLGEVLKHEQESKTTTSNRPQHQTQENQMGTYWTLSTQEHQTREKKGIKDGFFTSLLFLRGCCLGLGGHGFFFLLVLWSSNDERKEK